MKKRLGGIGDKVKLKEDVEYNCLLRDGVDHLKKGQTFTITSWDGMSGMPKLDGRWIISAFKLEAAE